MKYSQMHVGEQAPPPASRRHLVEFARWRGSSAINYGVSFRDALDAPCALGAICCGRFRSILHLPFPLKFLSDSVKLGFGGRAKYVIHLVTRQREDSSDFDGVPNHLLALHLFNDLF